MNTKLLMVAYLYPPHGGGGTQRTVKFAKYLPSFNIEPIILTSASLRKRHEDRSFSSAEKHKVVRVNSPRINDRLGRLLEPLIYPDLQRFWVKAAIEQGMLTAYREKVSAIYSTSMPYSNHLVGQAIAKNLDLPWIADFRDLWTLNALYKPRAPWAKIIQKNFEKNFYQTADHICVTSPSHRKILIKHFNLAPTKVTTITNGFDPEDFKDEQPAIHQGKIIISYFGSFYGKYRPTDFIEALKLIKKEDSNVLNNVKFVFVGDMDRGARNLLRQPELRDVLELSGYVPHGQLKKLRAQSSAFFLYLPKLSGPIGATIPQKVFEYMTAHKPIFSVLPPGDTTDILNKIGENTIVAPGDPKIIALALKKFLNSYKTVTAKSDFDRLNEFSRKTLTAKLARIINNQKHHAPNQR